MWFARKPVNMPRKIQITHYRPTQRTVRTQHRTTTATRHQEDNKSKTTRCILLDFLVTVKAAPHECVIRTGQP